MGHMKLGYSELKSEEEMDIIPVLREAIFDEHDTTELFAYCSAMYGLSASTKKKFLQVIGYLQDTTVRSKIYETNFVLGFVNEIEQSTGKYLRYAIRLYDTREHARANASYGRKIVTYIPSDVRLEEYGIGSGDLFAYSEMPEYRR